MYVLDTRLSLDSASPAPSAQQGDTFYWNLPILNPLQTTQINLYTTVDPGTSLNDFLLHTATVKPDTNDATPLNNIHITTIPVRGSFDPNFKEVQPDTIKATEMLTATPLQYTVHFQNTGTAAAHFVIIRDRLSPKLNLSTLRIVAASHTYRYHIEDNNLLVVTFDNIMLPDSNSNEPGSHGFVSFTIMPSEYAPYINTINNVANIYFDYNAPITTNTARVVITNDITTEIHSINRPKLNISVFPNPTNSIVNLQSDKEFTCILRDVWGREILQSASAGGLLQFSVNNLSAGMYYLQVTQDGITQAYSLSVINR